MQGCRAFVQGSFLLMSLSFGVAHSESQYPIINSTHHLLPSPGGELAPAIQAFVDIHGKEVMVIVSHNGQGQFDRCCLMTLRRPKCRGGPARPRTSGYGTRQADGIYLSATGHLPWLRRD
jgi:hypothetical protein